MRMSLIISSTEPLIFGDDYFCIIVPHEPKIIDNASGINYV